MAKVPGLALIGSGIFARTQYVPRLRELAHFLCLKAVWSRSQEAAESIGFLVKDFAPDVAVLFGAEGLQHILQDESIHGVVVVIAGQAQVELTLQCLRAGKHVLQEKPASSSVAEALQALSSYRSLRLRRPQIWAVAENYRFEPGLIKAADLVNEIGDMMVVEVVAEAPMNCTNPYFSSGWRRSLFGGFILDVGVHFVAGLRMVVGCEVTSVVAVSKHVDPSLPPPDNISALLQFENGCSGVFVVSLSSTSRKISWRVVGAKGTVEVERGMKDGLYGYTVMLYPANGKPQSSFYPFAGVDEELKAFAIDLHHVSYEGMDVSQVDKRSSPIEGARDVAVIEAILKSSLNNGAHTQVEAVQ